MIKFSLLLFLLSSKIQKTSDLHPRFRKVFKLSKKDLFLFLTWRRLSAQPKYLKSNSADTKNTLIDGPCRGSCLEKATFELYLFIVHPKSIF